MVIVVVAVFSSAIAGRIKAQTLTTLCHIRIPGSLILAGSTLYGTEAYEVFRVNIDGSGFAVLHTFTNGPDGIGPSGLALLGNTLIGTALGAPAPIYSMNTDGTDFTILGNFPTNVHQLNPGLILSGGVLYGMMNTNTVYRINLDGTGFTELYTLTNGVDGTDPKGSLILSGGILFGMTYYGGIYNGGTIFGVATNGTGLGVIHSFDGDQGEFPLANLLVSSNVLYGTTSGGGIYGGVYTGGLYNNGVIFSTDILGQNFNVLHVFTNSPDGAAPGGGLILFSNMLYGTTPVGGTFGHGTIFKMDTAGTALTIVYSFTAGSDGANPGGALISSGGVLYGTTGDPFGNAGTVFALDLYPPPPPPPSLAIARSGENVILSWPSSATNYGLQVTTSLPAGSWTAVTNRISANGTSYRFTNSVTGATAFFRLKSQ